ncbi:MAG: hypothetical protein JWN57_1917 [Frankiales bacterium]|nr:hypothetical protein [Frankiales bacterium]
MPESKKRKTVAATRPAATSTPKKKGPSPIWLAPLMLAMFGLGILWLVVFYLANGEMPILEDLQNWHLLIGFGFIVVGFGLSTQWR